MLEQSSLDQLEVGMNKEQVRYAIGEPILAEPFSQQQWDYIYLAQPGRGKTVRRLLTLHFDGDILVRIEGDWLPANQPAVEETSDTDQ